MDLDDIKQKASDLSPWAHIATVRADGTPDVTPVHPCWEGDTLWIMVGLAVTGGMLAFMLRETAPSLVARAAVRGTRAV